MFNSAGAIIAIPGFIPGVATNFDSENSAQVEIAKRRTTDRISALGNHGRAPEFRFPHSPGPSAKNQVLEYLRKWPNVAGGVLRSRSQALGRRPCARVLLPDERSSSAAIVSAHLPCQPDCILDQHRPRYRRDHSVGCDG